MSIASLRRLTALVVIAATLVTAGPAQAGSSSYLSRSRGSAADAEWTQVDGTPVGSSPFGNVHVGWLYAYDTGNGAADVFLSIADFDCEPGQLPDVHHGDEGGCAHVGYRYGEGFGLAFTMGRRLDSAALVGRVTLYGGDHGSEGVVGSPMIDMSWTAAGDLAKSTSTYRWIEGGTTYTERSRSTYRSAELGGTIGVMTFDVDLSGGSMSQYRTQSSSRTR